MQQFYYETHFNAPASAVFDYLTKHGAFERLKPPCENIALLYDTGSIEHGSMVYLEIREAWGIVKIPWVLKHQDYIQGKQFRDVQVKGPFASWNHLHQVVAIDEQNCKLIDFVEYALPLGLFTEWIGRHLISHKLKKLFSYREPVMQADIDLKRQQGDNAAMKILMSGATGMVGTALSSFLTTQGHQVTRLVRGNPKQNNKDNNVIHWTPSLVNGVNPTELEGFDAVIHLSGENIASGRWTDSKKKAIWESRVHSTQLLASALASVKAKPKVFVCASATGFYGETGSLSVDEASSKGQGFLSDTCEAWENACKEAERAGIRVVNVRTGIVLSPKGGALQKVLPIFLLGGGGVLGNGKQDWSWISIDDLVGVYYHAINNDTIRGPLNAVAPETVTNKEFTKTLGKVLYRPTIFPVPAFMLRLILGEMADALLLGSCKVKPTKLEETAYEYRTPELEPALKHLLGK